MSNLAIANNVQMGPGALLYKEGFESPAVVDASGYDNGVLPAGWVIANNGFGAGSIGLNNGDTSGDWTTEGTDVQGLDPNYTNSGAATDVGEIGTLNLKARRYRLTITVAYDKAVSGKPGADGGSASGDYKVMLSALEDGFDRQNWASGATAWADRALVLLQGTVPDDDQVHTFVGEYTTDPVDDISKNGYDLAIGVDGATSHAIITSVKVELIPGARRVNWAPDLLQTVAWYDAADPATITESGGAVSQLDDKSGNGYHVTQGNATEQPTTGSSIGGLNAIDFDGTDDFLEHVVAQDFSNGLTIVSIYDQDNTDQARPFGIRTDSGTNKEAFAQSADNTLRYDGAFGAGSITPTVGGHLRVSTKDATADNQTDYIDGSENITDNENLNLSSSAYIGIGAPQATNLYPFNGRIGECIIIEGAVSTDTRQKLEGYLAWKWGLEANLPVGHPYKDAAPTRLWTPEEITTAAWYDASAESTITESEGAVSQLNDKSGNNQHVTQGTPSDQPLTGVRTIGGLNALYADTNSKELVYSGAVPSMTNVMVMCVGTFLGATNYRPFVQMNSTVGNAHYVIQVEGSGMQTNFSTDDAGTFNKKGGGLTVGSPQIYGLSYDGAGVAAFIDGVGGGVDAITGAFSADRLAIFDGSETFEFGEWIVFDGSDVATRQKIEGYLAHKWGLEANLPASHPYKLAPPYV